MEALLSVVTFPLLLCVWHTISRGWISGSLLPSVATAEPTEQTPSNEEDGGARPAEEKGCSQLSLLTHVDGGVVEIPDDDVGCPAHRN